MICRDVDEAILDQARGVEDAAAAPALRAHLAGCVRCAKRLREQRALTAGLRVLAARHRAVAPSPVLEARLLARFEAEQAGAVPQAPYAFRRWMPAAAALLFVAGGLVGWGLAEMKKGGGSTTEEQAPSSVPVVSDPVPPGPQRAAVEDPPAMPRAARPVRKRATPASARFDDAAQFVPLAAAAALPEFESGEIVRLELPLTSLPVYGLEIPPDAENRPVQADLLVGQDGIARAIRLVSRETQDPRRRR